MSDTVFCDYEIYFSNLPMFIYKNLWILPTNKMYHFLHSGISCLKEKHLILNTMKDEGNTQK